MILKQIHFRCGSNMTNDFPSNVLRCVARLRTCSMLWPSLLSRVCVREAKKSRQNKRQQERAAADREKERVAALHRKVKREGGKRLTGQQIMLHYILRAGMMHIHMYLCICNCVLVCNCLDNENNTFYVLLHTHTHTLRHSLLHTHFH